MWKKIRLEIKNGYSKHSCLGMEKITPKYLLQRETGENNLHNLDMVSSRYDSFLMYLLTYGTVQNFDIVHGNLGFLPVA